MNVIRTLANGAKFITGPSQADARGFFCCAWTQMLLSELSFSPVEMNHSFSRRGVFRGLHIQVPLQAKLVRCTSGRIFDIAVDARPDSPTYGQAVTATLEEPWQKLYVPRGFLHGFFALEDSHVEYLVDNAYNPNRQISVKWDDPTLNIPWHSLGFFNFGMSFRPQLSDKDQAGIAFSALDLTETEEDGLDGP